MGRQSRLYSILPEQPIQLSFVKIELPSKTLLHYVTPNNNPHQLGLSMQCLVQHMWNGTMSPPMLD